MRHYEIVFLVHPDQGDQVPAMIDRYRSAIKKNKGIIHRVENLGKRQLAYPIRKVHKACYVLMNIECDQKTLEEIKNNFHFNDAIIRNLIINKNEAVTEPSLLSKEGQKHRTEAVVSDKVSEEPKIDEAEKETKEIVEESVGESSDAEVDEPVAKAEEE